MKVIRNWTNQTPVPAPVTKCQAFNTPTLGFLINDPVLALLPDSLDAGFLPGLSASKSFSAPSSHSMPILLCLGPQCQLLPCLCQRPATQF